MKYIKTYEYINNSPQIGDYVICHDTNGTKKLNDFLANNIGKVFFVYNYELDDAKETNEITPKDLTYYIKYENIPTDIKLSFRFGAEIHASNDIRIMSLEEIIFFSSNKNDVDAFLNSKKYNL